MKKTVIYMCQNALSPELREQLTHAVDTLHNKSLASGRAKPGSHWGWSDFLGADDALLNLVDLHYDVTESMGNFGVEYLFIPRSHAR